MRKPSGERVANRPAHAICRLVITNGPPRTTPREGRMILARLPPVARPALQGDGRVPGRGSQTGRPTRAIARKGDKAVVDVDRVGELCHRGSGETRRGAQWRRPRNECGEDHSAKGISARALRAGPTRQQFSHGECRHNGDKNNRSRCKNTRRLDLMPLDRCDCTPAAGLASAPRSWQTAGGSHGASSARRG